MTPLRAGAALLVLAGAGILFCPDSALAQKKQRDVITREEIQNSGQKDQDAFQAVRSLRPHFLAPPRGNRSLGAAPPAPTMLYVDGSRQGELTSLKLIMAADVLEVRYLDPSKAQDEYGITHSGGAVLVKMFKGIPKTPVVPPPPA